MQTQNIKSNPQVQYIQDRMQEILTEPECATHPFKKGMQIDNVKAVMAKYLAMSQSFSFIQAAAQGPLIFHCMENNLDAPKEMEITSVVGNFLCWDETGGNWTLRQKGMAGLPEILETGNFHSNLLKKDLEHLFGEKVLPNYDSVTKAYMGMLYSNLSSMVSLQRCATMVAFEAHAHQMIEAVWKRLSELLGAEKNKLIYFKVHVGGPDPAEAYHVDLTSRMIESLVKPNEEEAFLTSFKYQYLLNLKWCEQVCQTH